MSSEKPFVLMIDDDKLTNDFNALVVKRYHKDSDVLAFDNAMEALEYLKNKENRKPDIIFLDINMPVMNGWDFMSEYQKLGLEIEVVIVTSSKDETDEEKSRSFEDIKEYVVKPLNVGLVNRIVGSIFGRN